DGGGAGHLACASALDRAAGQSGQRFAGGQIGGAGDGGDVDDRRGLSIRAGVRAGACAVHGASGQRREPALPGDEFADAQRVGGGLLCRGGGDTAGGGEEGFEPLEARAHGGGGHAPKGLFEGVVAGVV